MTLDTRANERAYRQTTQDRSGQYQRDVQAAIESSTDLYHPLSIECQSCDCRDRYLSDSDAKGAGWRHVARVPVDARMSPGAAGFRGGTTHCGYCPECR